jgi:hypothetical protein
MLGPTPTNGPERADALFAISDIGMTSPKASNAPADALQKLIIATS